MFLNWHFLIFFCCRCRNFTGQSYIKMVTEYFRDYIRSMCTQKIIKLCQLTRPRKKTFGTWNTDIKNWKYRFNLTKVWSKNSCFNVLLKEFNERISLCSPTDKVIGLYDSEIRWLVPSKGLGYPEVLIISFSQTPSYSVPNCWTQNRLYGD